MKTKPESLTFAINKLSWSNTTSYATLEPSRYSSDHGRHVWYTFDSDPFREIICRARLSSEYASDDPASPWGWEILHHAIDDVTLPQAAEIVGRLKPICTRMNKFQDADGRPTSFGQYALRFMRAIGAKKIVFQHWEKCANGNSILVSENSESESYAIIGRINGELYRWHEENKSAWYRATQEKKESLCA